LRVYNSLSRKTEEFEPVNKDKVALYVCGITPYDYCHLGHARTYVAFDMIKRYLKFRGFAVYCVQNVTDIDDKIIRRAKECGQGPLELAAKFDAFSREDLASLGIAQADAYPKVTQNINEIIEFVKKLVDGGWAYANDTGVYFEISKFKEYGRLSGQSLEKIRSGARVEIDEGKKDPADFAVWKTTRESELGFESPWGRGRPGWHIECSTMSGKHIQGTIDIHGGARDLIFPHHENEIAQSEAAGNRPFVKYWLHTGFLTVNGEKMAKSLGNFITIRDALLKYRPYALRFFFLQAHYRSPMDYSDDAVEKAQKNIEGVFEFLSRAREFADLHGQSGVENEEYGQLLKAGESRIFERMDSDFDTPGALAQVFEIIRETNAAMANKDFQDGGAVSRAAKLVSEVLSVFGIETLGGIDIFTTKSKKRVKMPIDIGIENLAKIAKENGVAIKSGVSARKFVELLVEEREVFRKAGNYKQADLIREGLTRNKVIVEDL